MSVRATLVLLTLAVCGCRAKQTALQVYAAASLTDVAQELATLHEAETGQVVSLVVGPSSRLARQIAAGAPADVVLLAGDDWLPWLAGRRPLDSERLLARSGLVVIGNGESVQGPEGLARLSRLALADPAHVPAGHSAREAMQRAGVWEKMQGRVIALADVRAAGRAVALGRADAAIVYASDTTAWPGLALLFAWPDSLHTPVPFGGAVVQDSDRPEVGRAYLDRVQSRPDVWRSHGFEPVAAP